MLNVTKIDCSKEWPDWLETIWPKQVAAAKSFGCREVIVAQSGPTVHRVLFVGVPEDTPGFYRAVAATTLTSAFIRVVCDPSLLSAERSKNWRPVPQPPTGKLAVGSKFFINSRAYDKSGVTMRSGTRRSGVKEQVEVVASELWASRVRFPDGAVEEVDRDAVCGCPEIFWVED